MTPPRSALAGLLLVACAACGSSPAEPGAAPTAPASSAPASSAPAPATPTVPAEGLLGSRPATLDALRAEQDRRPVSVLVPGTRSPAVVQARTTDPVSRGLDLPGDARTVAWWGSGAAPGEPRGTVVLAAHVAYRGETGPFTRLAGVRPGAPVVVRSADGSVHRYAVVSVRSAPKTALDREALFGSDGPPALALVTCGGEYDERTRSYEDNVVVTAAPV